MDERIVLGSPVERGNSDIIRNYEAASGLVKNSAGKAAAIGTDGVVSVFASGAVFGVLGGLTTASKQTAVVEAGKKVGVQCAEGAEPAVGSEEVYVTSAGLFTTVANGNTKVRAKWRNAGLTKGVLADGGAEIGNCAYIDFIGGLATANVAA